MFTSRLALTHSQGRLPAIAIGAETGSLCYLATAPMLVINCTRLFIEYLFNQRNGTWTSTQFNVQ